MFIAKIIKSSINAKFISIYIIFCLIPLTILGSFLVVNMRRILIDREIQYMSSKIDYAYTGVNSMIEEMHSITNSLMISNDIARMLEHETNAPTYEWFREYLSINNLLSSLSYQAGERYDISIVCDTGKIFSSQSRQRPWLDWNHPVIQEVVAAGGDYVLTNLNTSGYSTNNIISLSRAIKSYKGVTSVIFVEAAQKTVDNIFSVFDNDNNLVYFFLMPDKLIYSQESDHLFTELNEAVAGDNAQGFINYGHENYWYRLTQPGKMNGRLITFISTSLVFAESNKTINFVLVSFLIVMMISSMIIILLSTRITKSIKALNSQVMEFGKTISELSISPPSTDEIGRLTDAFVVMSKRIVLLLDQTKEDEKNKRRLEFNALQSQINPHMIYNTLNTITNLAQIQGIKNIEEVSVSFVNLLRLISNSPGETIPIRDEIEYIKAFVEIKKYNMIRNIHLDINVQPEALEQHIMKLLLQPIVENSLIHAFHKTYSEAVITINVFIVQNKICVEISDNGIGMDKDTLDFVLSGENNEKDGFAKVGIFNTSERLRLKYGEDGKFIITSVQGQGSSVYIEYPY